MNISVGLGSHLYALIKVVPITHGDILEMGIGMSSTPYLHWSCLMQKRRLVSYETDEKYFRYWSKFAGPYHEMSLVESYDDAPIESQEWDIAFIDQGPNLRRIVDIHRIYSKAKYVVVHDTNPKLDDHYKFSEIFPLFRYHIRYPVARTHVSVLSNFVDVEKDLSDHISILGPTNERLSGM